MGWNSIRRKKWLAASEEREKAAPAATPSADLAREQTGLKTLLTKGELAEWLRLKKEGVDSLMKRKILREGIHYTRPRGMHIRFKRKPIEAWLAGERLPAPTEQDGIPLSKGRYLPTPTFEAGIPMAKGYAMK